MRIAQILLRPASYYDRKSRQIDHAALAARHEVIETDFPGALAAGAALAHVYGRGFQPPPRRRFLLPYVASSPPRARRLPWSSPAQPRLIVSPLENLPEAVDDSYFAEGREPGPPQTPPAALRTVGTFGAERPGITQMIEQTLARIRRFRDDVEWVRFDSPPQPGDLARVDLWADPAVAGDDFDGFVAEAIAAGKVVVASRTPINVHRLEKGRTGFLVPPRDPNELTHAILTALFKSEVAWVKIEAARQTAGKFRARHRLRALERIYEAVTE
ncbi:MAG TPA: glycosyltransferase [Thermoanaerobaculia bacterium]|nr:glycosyltransferase [Thermoanaerobaculia bacterium]